MHDLLQQMGREIVRQECPRDPGKWSRLCYPEVVNRVLTRKMVRENANEYTFMFKVIQNT